MMELFQELGCHLANGIHINPAYMTSLHTTSQEHLSTTTADANQVFSRPHNIPNSHHQLHLHHELALEGTDETRLFQLSPTACSNSTAISNINPSLNDANSSIGHSTISNFSSRQQHFSEILNAGCASTSPACRLKRRSWQEALSGSAANQTLQLRDLVGMSRSANTLVRPVLDLQHPTDELTSVDKILNLHNLESGVINHTSTDLINSTSLTVAGSTAKVLPPQESLIAAHDKKSMLALSPSNAGTFLSALSLGDEAFFKQQLLIPLEECKDKSINLQIAAATHDSAVFEDSEQQLYDALHDPNHMRQKHMHLQHGFSNGVKIPVQPNLVMVEQLIWGHEEGRSIVTNLSTRKPKMGSSTKIARPSSSAFVSETHKKHGEDDDENHVGTSQNSTQDHQHGDREDSHGRRSLGSANIGEILNVNVEGSESKKRSLCITDLGSASNSNMALSKRAHLEPHTRDNSYPRSSSSSTSLTITSSVMTGSTIMKSNGKASGRSSRHPLGPALNTNLKPRARQGTANDTQTVAARNRRDRINARLKVLQELVPNGAKVDLVTMLEKAINYVKFLQLQLRVLSNDEFWEANVEKDVKKVAMHEFEDISTCGHTRSTTTS